jgi:hypothetical protein
MRNGVLIGKPEGKGHLQVGGSLTLKLISTKWRVRMASACIWFTMRAYVNTK